MIKLRRDYWVVEQDLTGTKSWEPRSIHLTRQRARDYKNSLKKNYGYRYRVRKYRRQ